MHIPLSVLFSASPDPMLVVDEEGQIAMVNDRALRFFGYRADEIIGLKAEALMPERFRDRHAFFRSQFGQAPQAVHVDEYRDLHALKKNGTEVPVEITLSPVFGKGALFVACAIRDISKRKEIENQLILARQKAEEAMSLKSGFLASVSHEIRTPINAILGFAHVCLGMPLPERALSNIRKIHMAADNLLGIVNDILDYSKLEAGKLQIDAVEFDLGEVLQRLSSLFSAKAREKRIELVVGAMPAIPERLIGDALRLGQILTNLVGNSIKFTQRGEVAVTVNVVSQTSETIRLVFCVQDTGIGIEPEHLQRLFKPFEQADVSITRQYGGTGLGLAICAELIKRMEGEIHVKSRPGEGSMFSFELPFKVAVPRRAALASKGFSPVLQGKRIWVVDDNSVMRLLLGSTVKAFGCRVRPFENGEDALEALNDLQPDAYPDVVLMDWHLPGMNGLDTVLAVRKSGYSGPVLMITADDWHVLEEQEALHGIDGFISKPVTGSALHDGLLRILQGEACASEREPTEVAKAVVPDFTGRRLLLVDDNEFNRDVGIQLLDPTHAQIDTASNGLEALAALDQAHYDLVLMDLQMPLMDGYTAMSHIRERWPQLPVVALTAHAMQEERERVLQSGMHAFLSKPIHPPTLYAVIAQHMASPVENQAPIMPSARGLPTPQTPETTPKATEDAAAGLPPFFDRQGALERVQSNEVFLERFLGLFRTRNAAVMSEMEALLRLGDWPALKRQAHAIKGGARTVGFMALGLHAEQLEKKLAADKPDSDHVHEAFAAFAAAFEKAIRFLDERSTSSVKPLS
jgi:two-component system, sensor histidine kinase and response regulator